MGLGFPCSCSSGSCNLWPMLVLERLLGKVCEPLLALLLWIRSMLLTVA